MANMLLSLETPFLLHLACRRTVFGEVDQRVLISASQTRAVLVAFAKLPSAVPFDLS